MLSLRNRFGIPGVISVLALVFALVAGGAYAATDGAGTSAKKNNRAKKNRKAGGLNAKQKRQVRIIAVAMAKRFQGTGPMGPQGFPGLPGAPGEDGDDGSDGSDGQNGTDGADGNTVLSGFGAPNDALDGVDGDFYIDTAGPTIYGPKTNEEWGAGTDLKGTDGEPGDPWTVGGTLPSGETLTGIWSLIQGGAGQAIAPISFPIPLDAPLGSDNVHFATESDFADFDEGGPETIGCTGSAADPSAPDGHLCIYQAEAVFAPDPVKIFKATNLFTEVRGAATTGAYLADSNGSVLSAGTWAVTAP